MNLEEAKQIVFKAKPDFALMYEKYKNEKWSKYIETEYPKNPTDKLPQEFLDTLENILHPLLPHDTIEKTKKTISEKQIVSTCDHSGILCHPFFSNMAFARSIVNKRESIICFTCGGVSLTNSSLPRHIFFHDDNLLLEKFPLISLRGRRRSVYGLPSFYTSRIQSIVDKIKTTNLSPAKKEKLFDFLCDIKNHNQINSLEHYSDQLIIINNILWKKLFGEKLGELIYIESERIVRDLVLQHHLETKTKIHCILFDKETRKKYIDNFEKITGGHLTENHLGSHLFWYIDEIENKRTALFVDNDSLKSLDGKINISLNPHVIRELLLRFELLPTTALTYSILAFYYGLTLGGGFSQISYLGDMKKAWEDIFDETLNTKTNLFSGEMVLSTLQHNHTQKMTTSIDLLIHSKNPEIEMTEAINTCLIGETIDGMMEEFVEIITGKRPQIKGLPKNYQINV